MQDKYIGILNKHICVDCLIEKRHKEAIAQELHALRYEVTRQVVRECWEDMETNCVCFNDIIDWLADQGETITIGRDNK